MHGQRKRRVLCEMVTDLSPLWVLGVCDTGQQGVSDTALFRNRCTLFRSKEVMYAVGSETDSFHARGVNV